MTSCKSDDTSVTAGSNMASISINGTELFTKSYQLVVVVERSILLLLLVVVLFWWLEVIAANHWV